VEEDYGQQGYHGLKGQMSDNFIRLGDMKDVRMSKKRIPEPTGNYYILHSSIIAPSDGIYDLLSGEVKPFLLFINNSKTDVNSNIISLKKGVNTILLIYNMACETYFIVRKPGIQRPEKQKISMAWYKDYGVLPFNCSPNNKSAGLFTFESAPGLQSLTFAAHGKVTLWIDGIQFPPVAGQKQPDGLIDYNVNIKNPKLNGSRVVLKIEYQPGYNGAGALTQYFRQQCGKGSINLGDWSKTDGLKAYSGGAVYRKIINVDSQDLQNKMEVDLGDLVSSAEVSVNGRSAGIRVSPPWTFDITQITRPGENQIEIVVYNTLANNYTSIPTRYGGSIKSGLFGPVVLRLISNP
jgi:hypothetical protein